MKLFWPWLLFWVPHAGFLKKDCYKDFSKKLGSPAAVNWTELGSTVDLVCLEMHCVWMWLVQFDVCSWLPRLFLRAVNGAGPAPPPSTLSSYSLISHLKFNWVQTLEQIIFSRHYKEKGIDRSSENTQHLYKIRSALWLSVTGFAFKNCNHQLRMLIILWEGFSYHTAYEERLIKDCLDVDQNLLIAHSGQLLTAEQIPLLSAPGFHQRQPQNNWQKLTSSNLLI